MPLFKRRNAVKGKHGKNVPDESHNKENETSVISEVNSMLNDLVNAVSEQTDLTLRKDVSKDSVKEDECCSPNSTNCISEQKNFSQENYKCSNSSPRNSISMQKASSQESDQCGIANQTNSSSIKIDYTQNECVDAIKTNNVSNNTNSSQEDSSCMKTIPPIDIIKQIDSNEENDERSKPDQIEDVSNETSSSQNNDEHEKFSRINDFSNEADLTQTNDEETITLSTNGVSEEIDSTRVNNEHIQSLSSNKISDVAKQDVDDSKITKDDSSDCDSAENVSVDKQFPSKKTRSSSESGSRIESQTKHVRRKFGSEAEIMSICQKILPPEQQQGINEAVVKYIDKLIKESIFKAVQNINVDNLCEELIKDASNRKSSQSTESEEEFVVEQRLNSNSISELVELQNVGSKINENENDSFVPECDSKLSETESLGNDDIDQVSFGGYLADLEDTGSIDDVKSAEEDSLCNSLSSGLEHKLKFRSFNSESSENIVTVESSQKTVDNEISKILETNEEITDEAKIENSSVHSEITHDQEVTATVSECIDENEKAHLTDQNIDHLAQKASEKNLADDQQEHKNLSKEDTPEKNETLLSPENLLVIDEDVSILKNINRTDLKFISSENSEISLKSLDEETSLLMKNDLKMAETQKKGGSLPNQNTSEEERMKINWKVGNLHVKLPHKSRGKTSLKAWKKRRVVIQPDEFVNDPTNQSLVISVYGSKKHETTFWYSVSSQKAVVFRSSSHTHRYAFTISEGGQAIIHLSAENESETQEWMAAIRAVLWPPSPFMELEKMLSGQEFEVSIIDNEFSYHAGLLGMYGYLSITPKKLILLHPQQGYVIQEWYLNTVDKFQFVLQQKADDMHKVLCMTTCKDSSTGQGNIIFFCKEAVTLLQSLASTIHQVLSYHSKQEGGKYQKELEELAEWMVAPPQDCLNVQNDEHYKVPPRQVKSLLDIPNFIFNKSLSPVASAIYPAPNSEVVETLDATKNKLINTSQDSGISTCTSSDDFLNCSTASFVLGGGPMTGKSSDSELSDAYSPPRTPELMKKKMLPEVVKEEPSVIKE